MSCWCPGPLHSSALAPPMPRSQDILGEKVPACLPEDSLEHRLKGSALCRGMNKGSPIKEEAPSLVVMVTHGERRTWTTGIGFISKDAREEEEMTMEKRERSQGGERETERSKVDREREPHRAQGRMVELTLSPLGPGRPAAPRSPGIP